MRKNNNILTVLSNKKLDYEHLDSPKISIEVKVMDDGIPSLSLVRNLSLIIKEVNERASEIRPANVTLNETQLSGTNISELTCNDPEKWQTVEYSLLSYQDTFMIKTINHTVTYKHPILTEDGIKQDTFQQIRSFLFLRSNLSYNYNQINLTYYIYNILVRVTDNGIPPLSFNGTVNVTVMMVNPCDSVNHCHENATCTKVDGVHYNCSCKSGFAGDGYNCTNINDCEPSRCNGSACCKNNGTCHDLVNNYTCSCQAGFNGSYCYHNINECKLYHDCHNGLCVDAVNNFTCNCHRGYDRWLCDRNIDDCAPNPCGKYGECIDGVDSYSCNCWEGYVGTRCNRPSEICDKHPCLDNQYCNEYLLNTSTTSTQEKHLEDEYREIQSQDICFSGENITTIYLPKYLTRTLTMSGHTLDNVKNALKIALEDWFLKNIRILFVYLETSGEDYWYNISDIRVLDGITENAENISVPLIVRVGNKAVSEQGFFCALAHFTRNVSKQCPHQSPYPYDNFTCKTFSYTDYLCYTVQDPLRYECVDPTKAKLEFQKGSNSATLLPWVIYTLASIGGVLFLVIIGFALYGNRTHKFNLQEALRRGQQYDHVRLPEEDDEHYRDVMFRHHISTTMTQSGAVNPIYDLNEDETDEQMIVNPLYKSTHDDSPPTDGLGFMNPLYGSVQREQGLRAKPVTKTDLIY